MVERREVLDATYRALAHPNRRAVLEMLREGPLRVTDVARPFPVSLAAISKHVGILESAGLVHRSVSGRDHLLALDAEPLVEARGWIDQYRSFWEGRLDSLEARFRDGR